MRASPSGIRISSERGRGSGRESKRDLSDRNRESAERSLGALPRGAMGPLHRVDEEMGDPGKRDANALYEMRIQTERPVKEKTTGRELLISRRDEDS